MFDDHFDENTDLFEELTKEQQAGGSGMPSAHITLAKDGDELVKVVSDIEQPSATNSRPETSVASEEMANIHATMTAGGSISGTELLFGGKP